MDALTLAWLAVGLGMDAFAVSIVVGSAAGRLSFRPIFRLSFHFGLFQFLMPIIGWGLGLSVASYIEAFDHWLALALLTFVGGKMIMESRSDASTPSTGGDPTRGWTLVALSVATSIDALAVGLSMAFLRVDVLTPSVIIGIVACAMTAIGMSLGSRLGRKFGRRMELIGGLVLISIGIRIVVEHLGLLT
jgi:putative Mn2+ efflux pump MntP